MPRDAASHVDVADPLRGGAARRGGGGTWCRTPARTRPACPASHGDGDVEHREEEPLRDRAARCASRGRSAVGEVPSRRRASPARATARRPAAASCPTTCSYDCAVHEAVEGREAAVQHQLEVAELPLRESDGRHVEGQTLQRFPLRLVDEERLQRYPGRRRFDGHAFSRRCCDVGGKAGEAAPQTGEACTAPLPGASLSGALHPSQPSSLHAGNHFRKLRSTGRAVCARRRLGRSTRLKTSTGLKLNRRCRAPHRRINFTPMPNPVDTDTNPTDSRPAPIQFAFDYTEGGG